MVPMDRYVMYVLDVYYMCKLKDYIVHREIEERLYENHRYSVKKNPKN